MKQKIIKGMLWKILESGGAQGVQFVVTVILARLLTPAEYGVVGLIMIFITIANALVQNGFSTALVQRSQADETDFSSVCCFELLLSAAVYALLYLAAPYIAGYYRIEILEEIVRVMGIVLFPGAVISVQTAYVSRKMEFRGLFLSTLFASAVSGVFSIWMAAAGYGVWAMVGQQISYYVLLMISLFAAVPWRPRPVCSPARIGSMFSFGWKLLCAGLIDTVFTNLYGLIIGKLYNEEQLGAFNRGEQFPKLIASNLGAAIQAVLLPAFSSRQSDTAAVRRMVRRAVRLSSFVVMPMLAGLFAVADTLVFLLLGEQWMVCVPFLRIMCVYYCFWPIHITNLQAVNAMGRSDIFLKLEIIKKATCMLLLLIGLRYSVYVMVALRAFHDFLCTFIDAAPNRKLIGYGAARQWKDVLPSLGLSAAMCAAVMAAGAWMGEMNILLKLFLQVLAGAVFYILGAWLFQMESFRYLLNTALRTSAVKAE